jgi:hypothetical protein
MEALACPAGNLLAQTGEALAGASA